jgi:hypothetical protein
MQPQPKSKIAVLGGTAETGLRIDTAQLEPSGKSKSLLGLETRPITPEVARQLSLRTTEGVVVARVEE